MSLKIIEGTYLSLGLQFLIFSIVTKYSQLCEATKFSSKLFSKRLLQISDMWSFIFCSHNSLKCRMWCYICVYVFLFTNWCPNSTQIYIKEGPIHYFQCKFGCSFGTTGPPPQVRLARLRSYLDFQQARPGLT